MKLQDGRFYVFETARWNSWTQTRARALASWTVVPRGIAKGNSGNSAREQKATRQLVSNTTQFEAPWFTWR